ncbi:DNA-directed RNA polymerase subunit alpha C-terminal domain-containing protein [Adhaeribacter terreus]|uniref:DNA-directed RNA polymerase subunit alpha C-terminal domain-containing protein n=1 Tax=Adhaeribacter terreus TaxID=529703 RepID=A0ABW0E5K2_9BACT
MPSTPKLKTCENGHQFYKSSECPTCPVCEKENKPESGFMAAIAAPARRALQNKGITSLQQLSEFSEKEILELHGIGKTSLPKLRDALATAGLAFKSS